MSLVLIAFLAGMFSVLTPCILPVLPALLIVSDGQGKARIVGIVSGVVISFCAAILFLTAIIDALQVPDDVLRYVAATMMLIFGLVLIVPRLDDAFQNAAQVVVRISPAQNQGNGLVPGFLAGATLGLVWAPCAGPILGGITSLIAQDGIGTKSLVATLAYGFGMAVPLTGVVFGGRALVGKLRKVSSNGRRVNVAMGLILLLTSAVFFAGYETTLNRKISEALPFTSTPIAGLERDGFDSGSDVRTAQDCDEAEAAVADRQAVLDDGYPETGTLCDLGPAPDLDTAGPWINTKDGSALTKADLKGKVVLVDFWTYSCINCLRTLPHLRSWYEQYEDDGFVIVGVHTPEFGFEKSEKNVRKAVKDLDVEWPVAQDNDYDTWNAYGNRFWPSKYLIDQAGNVRTVHYGEGEYDETESLIRELLGLDDSAVRAAKQDDRQIEASTPETYLGYARAANFAARANGSSGAGSGISADKVTTYVPEPNLAPDAWSLEGSWKVASQNATAVGDSATLRIRYDAREAYLVMSPPPGSASAQVTPSIDGVEQEPITVDSNQLYTVASKPTAGEHLLELDIPSGVSVYAFTFG